VVWDGRRFAVAKVARTQKGEKNDEFADRRPDVYTAMFRAVNVRFVESGGPRQLERAERAPTRYVACIPRVYLRRVSGN